MRNPEREMQRELQTQTDERSGLRRLRFRLFDFLCISHLAVCILLAPPFLASPASAKIINKVIATVDGDPITLYELRGYEREDIRTRQGSARPDSAVLLDALITDRLIAKEAVEKGVIVRDEDVDRYVNDIKQRNKLSDEQLNAALEAQGLTVDEYRKQIRHEIERQQLIGREIRGKVSVTPEEVQRYYESHLSEYETPKRFKIAHIVLALPPDASAAQVEATKAEAQLVYDQIEDGADFAEMAKQYSQDSTASSGGELGWFEPKQLVDSLADAAAQLQPGEVSPPVEGPGGIHLVKLLEVEEASHQDLGALQEEIKEKLYAAALEERFTRWLNEELRKRHDVDIRP